MAAPTRRSDIDLLRVFATVMLFVFHTCKVFDRAPFYQVKNGELSAELDVFTGFIHLWHMPLFFALAGWSAHASLARRGWLELLAERRRRIVVPFVFGCLVLCPPMQYVWAMTAKGFTGSFLDFVPLFFTSFAWFSWSHLWFLAYLLTFTVVYLPWLVRVVRTPPRTGPLPAWLPLVPLVPLVAGQALLRPIWPGWQNLVDDWANFVFYSTFFLTGFWTAASPAFEDALSGRWRRLLVVAVSASAAMLLVYDVGGCAWWIGHYVLAAFAGYGFVFGAMGWARRHVGNPPRWLPAAAEAALPVYVLHQAFIVLPGWWVVSLPWGIPAKLGLLLVIAISGAVVAYAGLVRPWNTSRRLFGMPPILRLDERRGDR